MKTHLKFLIPSLASIALTLPLTAQDEDTVAKLRYALRNAILQQRELQAQIANLQAKEIADKQQIEKLQADLKKLNQQAVEERNASANLISELKTTIAERDATIAGQQAAIQKWRVDYNHAIERARNAEADNAKKASQILALERLVEAQRTQNVQMYLTGMEILKRYDNFWFGDALLAREPFVAKTRVKLQNLAQEGHDKLLAARIRDAQTTPPSSQSSSPTTNTPEPTIPNPSTAPKADTNQNSSPQNPHTSPKENTTPPKKSPSPDGINWPQPQPA